jgi:hypothetical protein
LYFSARGGGFFVTLSTSDDTSNQERQTLTLAVADTTGDAMAYVVPPSLCTTTSHREILHGLNAGFAPDHTVRFLVEVDTWQKTATLSHTGPSRLFTSGRLLRVKTTVNAFSAVSFATCNAQVLISNVFATTTRLPEVEPYSDPHKL